MGRPELARAMASIAAQTYRPIEIVLVDAAGAGIPAPRHAGLGVRLVSRGPLDRAAAANAGLEAARGAWIGFLDEDDELAPEHVASLVSLAASSGAPVAFSQTRLVDRAGNTTRLLGGPFDRQALLRSNYIAIHAALFRRTYIEAGARFDPEMVGFEDWDFWLQLATRGEFAFTGDATAIYHAEEGASGSGTGGNLDREAALARRERLMRKWQQPVQ